MGVTLLYTFRIIERQTGTFKFASLVVAVFAISVVLEVALTSATAVAQPGGPYVLIFTLLVLYFARVPKVCIRDDVNGNVCNL